METTRLRTRALYLTLFTILYNVGEGLVSIYFAAGEGTLALLGFGIDSFIEVISAAGVLHMLVRLRRSSLGDAQFAHRLERQALRVTAAAFFLLSAGLIVGSAVNVLTHASPRSTVAGVVISLVSIAAMYALMRAKLSVGRRLGSDAIVADANCTKTCLYLSFILLAASLLYELTSLMWFDVLGSLGIAWFSFTEGREALEKARSGKAACGCSRA